MSYVLTLITNPSQRNLTDEDIATASVHAVKSGFRMIGHEWLSEGEALDLWLDGEASDARWVAKLAEELTVDAVLQPDVPSRRKKMLISDMDSTIITIECIDELADELGIKPQVAVITERAMNGELDFEQALIARVALLAGLDDAALKRVYDSRVKFMAGAEELLATMRAHGAYTMLVSGGFTYFTNRVRDALKFDEDRANTLEMQDGKLTGKVGFPILGKEAKLAALQEACIAKGFSPEDVLAIGDGANDLPMLLAAGMGIAYHAKPSVQAQAHAVVTHANLRGALFVQGYHAEEITR